MIVRGQVFTRGRSFLLGRNSRCSTTFQCSKTARFFSGLSSNDDDGSKSNPTAPEQQEVGFASCNDFLLRIAPYVTATLDPVSSGDPTLSTYLLLRLVDYGVPAAVGLGSIVASIAAFNRFQQGKGDEKGDSENPVSELYTDLYGDQKQAFDWKTPWRAPRLLPKNAGIPSHQYLKVTYLNGKLDSYDFSLESKTRSKSAAASAYRKKSLQRALGKALTGAESPFPPSALEALEKAERDLLKEGKTLISTIQEGHATLTRNAVDDEFKRMGLETPYDLYPNISAAEEKENTSPKQEKPTKNSFSNMREQLEKAFGKVRPNEPHAEVRKQVEKAMAKLQRLELEFIRKVIQAGGKEHAQLLRTALLADDAARGSPGSLLLALEDRPLKSLLAARSETTPRVYVVEFRGGLRPDVEELRETVTAIVRHARPGVDKVLVVLKSGGGTVTGYGLAAGQLLRVKNSGIQLTVAVEEVAASGGYMMCCVADRITASPFAALGSIGVVSEMPNVHGRLKREGVEFATVTAGKYKRKLTPFKEITQEDLDSSKQDMEDILAMFRNFITQNRPQLNMDEVATGEVWFGTDAVARKLCDEIKTVDDVLVDYMDQGYEAYKIEYAPSSPLKELTRHVTEGDLSLDGAGSATKDLAQLGVRWLMQTAMQEVKANLGSASNVANHDVSPTHERYRIEDPRARHTNI